MEKLVISTPSKEYPIYIGQGVRLKVIDLIPHFTNYSSVLIISDENVASLYLEQFEMQFTNLPVLSKVVPSGEEAKTFDVYNECLSYALESGLDRQSVVIALGGGAVGDLAGFVAATYMRGISFVQVPTTILAHDSSVGGKTGINHTLGKNMIGAFHQPDAVIYDITTLNSLPYIEKRSGYAEVIKHAIIGDPELFKWLQANVPTLDELQGDKLEHVLKRGIQVKAAIVSQDEHEKGIRAHLNFGHTLGHAIEALVGYGKISHGDAVAIGMKFALLVSAAYYQGDSNYERVTTLLDHYDYPDISNFSFTSEQLLSIMKKDKKVQQGSVRMVLLKQLGQVETVSLSDEFLKDMLDRFVS